jgi:hypothetical protein
MPNLLRCQLSRVVYSVFCAGLLLSLSACGPGDGQGLDADGNLLTDASAADSGVGGGDLPPGASGNPNATLAWVQTNVFGGVCTQCHTGAGAPLGVDWSTESATCANVGRASGEKPELEEVDSANPAGSYVVWKIEGAGPSGEAIVGEQMPLANPPLSAAAIKNISDWIGDGTPGCGNARPGPDSAAGKSVAGAGGFAYPEGTWPYVWEHSLRLCSTCHSLAPSHPQCVVGFECPPRGLVLDADNYYGLFDGTTLVPFDLEASRLWIRVSRDEPEPRMPLGYPPLTEAQLEIIRNWILDGAPLTPHPDD